MGRKKKTETIETEPSIKNIEVKSNTPIAYKGTVQIKVRKGNKIVSNTTKRNSGAEQMFKYLAYCLYGELRENLAPKYVILMRKTTVDNDSTHTILSRAKTATGNVINNNVVSKQFLVPYNAIITGGTCNELVLTNVDSLEYFNGSTISESDLSKYASAIIELVESQDEDNQAIDLSGMGIDDAILIVWGMEIKDYSQGGSN